MKRFYPTLILISVSFALQSQSPLWLRYPAISPDGSTIAFEYKGDIYTVPAGGGDAQLMTASDAYDYAPVWSNDGKSIAFASNKYDNFDVFTIPAKGGTATRLTFFSGDDIPETFSSDDSKVYFQSTRLNNFLSVNFPYFSQFYSVPVNGGREIQELTFPLVNAKFNQAGDKMIFEDWKSGEFYWRKHHTSSATRDIWMWDKTKNLFTQLTGFSGEDLYPNWSANEQAIYYVSEEDGTANIWRMSAADTNNKKQISHYIKNPVRFLTVSKTGRMCYGYNGEIYTADENGAGEKVKINILLDDRYPEYSFETLRNGATELAVSPDGKSVAFAIRGEIFVASTESGVTRRVTNTPGQERGVNFSPDGRKVVYASERNNIWGIYQTSITNDNEPYFYSATLLNEEPLIVNDKESFQPVYSPDGNKIAYLEERTTLKVYDLKTKQSIVVLPGNLNYSYSDGDQYFSWAPDGKHLLVQFLTPNAWITQVGLVSSNGNEPLVNLTHSGYDNYIAKWCENGKSMIWFSGKNGLRNQRNTSAEVDVYQMFFTKKGYDRSKLTKEELETLNKMEEKEKENATQNSAGEEKNKKGNKNNKDSLQIPAINIDTNHLRDRTRRLTISSAYMADAVLTPDGEQLFYVAKFDQGWDIWSNKMRSQETKLFARLNAGNVSSLSMDSAGKNLFLIADGAIIKIAVESGEQKNIPFSAEMQLNTADERAYMFEHIWRQVQKKFYVADLNNVDWSYYKENYQQFLPYINNGYDFSEMVSEMLGELNCSHTGCYYYAETPNGDNTASLGFYPDESYVGAGIRIGEILETGPLDQDGTRIKRGTLIKKIDGMEITPNTDYYKLLNWKTGKPTLLELYDPSTKLTWAETVKPISRSEERELEYKDWVKKRTAEVDSLSNGKIGYVHVLAMNDASFRTVFDKVLGENMNKEALIVDIRYNGGGWLHDDLVTFLNGNPYVTYIPRGQTIGTEPLYKWNKPSAVIMGEANYSDAHMFPYAYKTFGLGKLIGMPVAGTGTAVWWEALQDPAYFFGIPEVGVVTGDGKYLENNQLEPDIKVKNSYTELMQGRDEQIEAAVKELLGQ